MTVYDLMEFGLQVSLVLWPFTIVLLAGLIRLFIFGRKYRYLDTVKDVSAFKKGDILLLGKQGVTHSWYIQLSNVLTGKLRDRFWTHAAIYKGDGKLWEAVPEGVLERDLSFYLSSGYIVSVLRYKFGNAETVFGKIDEFCADNTRSSYGFVGAVFYTLSTFLPVGLNFLFDNPTIDRLCRMDQAYFCSELIVDAYAYAGHPISGYDGWRVKPADLLRNPCLSPLTKGETGTVRDREQSEETVGA